jgi:hypothetical protein
MKLVPPSADRTTDYHWHYALIRYPDIYAKGKALGSDVIVEIVDFKLLFSSTRQFPAPTLVGWIYRGADTRIIHAIEKVGAADDRENPGWQAALDRLEAEALAERENAVARTAINLSLAIRRALDRIAEHRGERLQ